MTRKLRKQNSFHLLLRLKTGPVIYSFLVRYKRSSYPGPGKLMHEHETGFSKARWKEDSAA